MCGGLLKKIKCETIAWAVDMVRTTCAYRGKSGGQYRIKGGRAGVRIVVH